jgi:FAD-linked sulfhydryl oxidase
LGRYTTTDDSFRAERQITDNGGGDSGECAGHFRQILNKFPPQVATRSTAAAWACHVHNEVNKSLKKPLFDCSKIGDFYDCGCADDEKEGKGKSKGMEGPSIPSSKGLELHKEG